MAVALASRAVITSATVPPGTSATGKASRRAAWVSASARPSASASAVKLCPASSRSRASPQPSVAPRSSSTTMARSASQVSAVAGPAALGPAVEPGHVGHAGPVERVVDLDVEVAAQLQPPEQLEHGHVPEHHRGVALLAGEHPRRQVGGQSGPFGAVEPGGGVPVAQPGLVHQGPEQDLAGLRVAGRVVGDHRAELRVVEPGHLGDVQVGVRRRPVGQRELVELPRASVVRGDRLPRAAGPRRVLLGRPVAGFLLHRVRHLGDLQPHRRGGLGEERGVSCSQGSGVRERRVTRRPLPANQRADVR